mmetsp:Transcript_7742/g.12003  ORF Transcript_7742/g.12003 Transcript_7742/m.12003 type:complete len:181 (-) Transcript_7742:304-846(-)
MQTRGSRPKFIISVVDTGVGIKVADQMKLFKLFGRVESTHKINTKGVGLGLSICKMIVEEFSGSVAVHSKKGRGSIFQACCPLILEASNIVRQSKEEEELASILSEQKKQQAASILKHKHMLEQGLPLPSINKRIMVVDDEAYNCEVLQTILVSFGIPLSNIVTCLSGKEALSVIETSVH